VTAQTVGLLTNGGMPKPGSTNGRSANLAESMLAETRDKGHFRGSFDAITKAVAEIRSASNYHIGASQLMLATLDHVCHCVCSDDTTMYVF